MTDEELIEMLRAGPEIVYRYVSVDHAAADRIEELVKERDDAEQRGTTQIKVNHQRIVGYLTRVETAEAKLAKAGIVALKTILDERGPVFDAMVEAAEDADLKHVSFNVVVSRAIRAALAELEKTE